MNLIQLIYCTTNRVAYLTPAIHTKLCAYQGGILKDCASPPIVIGGATDHVHVLFV